MSFLGPWPNFLTRVFFFIFFAPCESETLFLQGPLSVNLCICIFSWPVGFINSACMELVGRWTLTQHTTHNTPLLHKHNVFLIRQGLYKSLVIGSHLWHTHQTRENVSPNQKLYQNYVHCFQIEQAFWFAHRGRTYILLASELCFY